MATIPSEDEANAEAHAEAQAYADRRRIDDRFTRMIAYCRASLPLSPADLERIERIKLLLVARGIEPDDDSALAWLSPALCSNAEEQRHFHQRFEEYRRERPEQPKPREMPKSVEAVPRSSGLQAFLRRDALLFGGVPALLLGIVLAARLIPRGQDDDPAFNGSTEIINTIALGGGTMETRLEPDGPAIAILVLAAFAAIALFDWMRRRRERLLDNFKPAPHEAAAAVMAEGAARLFSTPWLARTFGMLRRHKEAPSRRMDVRRSIRATVRAAGRPEIRLGSRPATPEYLLLVDRQSPRDHLLVVGDALQQQFAREGIVASRFDHVGKPDRLRPVPAADSRPAMLADTLALHEGARVIALAEARDCAGGDSEASLWKTMFEQLDQPTLLDPRRPRRWTALEREIEDSGVLVVPATPEGLGWYAEAINLRGLKWPGRWPATNAFEEDPVEALLADRKRLLDDRPPPAARVAELLVDLRHSLGEPAFRLLSTAAVYPAVDPAFTLHLTANLPAGKEGSLLTEATWLAVARLPWMRLGHIPSWLRAELIRGLDPETLAATSALVQAFVLPKAAPDGPARPDPGEGGDERERVRLLHWIGCNPESELHDPLLFDALRGVPPERIGALDPGNPGRPLSLWRGHDALVGTALAAVLAALAWTNPPLTRVADSNVPDPPIQRNDVEPLDGNSIDTGGNTLNSVPVDGNTIADLPADTGQKGKAALPGPPQPGPPPPPSPPPGPPPQPRNADGPFYVFFDWNSTSITPEAAKNLDTVASRWKQIDEDYPTVLILGYTDRDGDEKSNLLKSQAMANGVARYLIAQGIDSEWIQTRAFGEARSLVPTADGIREPQNRRVEIYFQYSFGPEGEPTNTAFGRVRRRLGRRRAGSRGRLC